MAFSASAGHIIFNVCPLSSSGSQICRSSSSQVEQLHPPLGPGTSKYEKNAAKYWEKFYQRHQNKFFKDRHYLEKERGHYFSLSGENENETTFSNRNPKVVLEVGCGAGNTVFPLLAGFPNLYIHACDFCSRAVSLVQANEAFTSERVNAFVCDLTTDDLSQKIRPESVDVVTLIFMLSAVAPAKMSTILQNIRRVIKPNGHILLRDYAVGDYSQEKLADKSRMISDNFYVRGDGTCAFYFSADSLGSLFDDNGYNTTEISPYCILIENRHRKVKMQRYFQSNI